MIKLDKSAKLFERAVKSMTGPVATKLVNCTQVVRLVLSSTA